MRAHGTLGVEIERINRRGHTARLIGRQGVAWPGGSRGKRDAGHGRITVQ